MKFVDLERQYQTYKEEIDREIQSVLDSTAFINGPSVGELERDLERYLGSGSAIACSSGTDALLLPMMALGVTAGDEILVPAFTFIATATMVKLLGAKPIFVDVDPETFTIDPEQIEANISEKSVGIIPVSLYGQCADMEVINASAERHDLWVMEDAAQSFGASRNGKPSCMLSGIATTSFFPAKPLGGYGDGGAIFTQDKDLAVELRSVRNHGQEGRYNHTRLGLNARMDTLQAAILKVKLKHYPEELNLRNSVASAYSEQFGEVVKVPVLSEGNTSSWAQYTIVCTRRDELRQWLSERDIPTAVHYPKPLHRQPVFQTEAGTECPVADRLSREVLSLPMHPFLKEDEIISITESIREFYDR